MAVTDRQSQELLNRVTALEESVNDILIAINRLVALSQVQQLFTVIQTQLTALENTVTGLDERVSAIEEDPNI